MFPSYLGLVQVVVLMNVSGSDHGQLSLNPLYLHLRLPQQLFNINTRSVIPHYHLQNVDTHTDTKHTVRPVTDAINLTLTLKTAFTPQDVRTNTNTIYLQASTPDCDNLFLLYFNFNI